MGPQARPRVFLDSNVIFSGLYSSAGAPGRILERFIQGELRVVISQQVLEEVVRTIGRKLPEVLSALRRLLESSPPEIVQDPSLEEVARWVGVLHPADAGILAAAAAAQVDCLVTGDRHFFEKPETTEMSGLRIITPAQFLERMEKGNES